MEMPSSFRGDKHEFCLVVIKFKQRILVGWLECRFWIQG